MSKKLFCLISLTLILGLANSAVAYDWSIGVQNQINYTEFTLSGYNPPGPPAVWAGDDNLWEEALPGRFSHDKPFLMKRNSEYTSGAGALGLSLEIPNGDYDIVMSRVFFHGAKSEGGGFAEFEVTVEGKYLYDLFCNDGLQNTRDLGLFVGPRKITVTDRRLDLVIGQCRTTRVNQGRKAWFSFEGFKITRVAAPDSQLPGNPSPTGIFVPDKTLRCELNWSPGDTAGGANGYQIYFGDNFDDVSNADISDTTGIYRGSVSAEVSSYAVPETVQLGKIYYWRIDQVSNSATRKGYIWNFKVADYLVVDDMESYNQTKNISEIWKDGPDGNFKSTVSLDTAKGHNGRQAIKFTYDNSGTGNAPHYSEIKAEIAELGISSDWIGAGLKALELWFCGTAGNSAERMYLTVEDTGGKVAIVPYDGQAPIT